MLFFPLIIGICFYAALLRKRARLEAADNNPQAAAVSAYVDGERVRSYVKE